MEHNTITQRCIPKKVMSILGNGKYSDLTILLYLKEDAFPIAEILTHKVVIESCCPAIYQRLTDDTKIFKILNVPESSIEIFQGLFNAMYTGEYEFKIYNTEKVKKIISTYFTCFNICAAIEEREISDSDEEPNIIDFEEETVSQLINNVREELIKEHK